MSYSSLRRRQGNREAHKFQRFCRRIKSGPDVVDGNSFLSLPAAAAAAAAAEKPPLRNSLPRHPFSDICAYFIIDLLFRRFSGSFFFFLFPVFFESQA